MADLTLARFATDLYADAEVAELCLVLQDKFDADVTVLLFVTWRVWLDGRAIDDVAIADLTARIGPWRDQVVAPLRAVRRWLKLGLPPSPDGLTEALRTKVKQIELEAEMIALGVLESSLPVNHAPRPDEQALRSSLLGMARILASPRVDFDALCATLERYGQAVWRRLTALGLNGPTPAR